MSTKKVSLTRVRLEESIELPNIPLDELSPEQRIAYDKYISGENLFITGPGGTGKTKLIQYFLQYATASNQKISVCAMTGCAAILLNCNARTIHSWSGIKLAKGDPSKIVTSVLSNRNCVKSWKAVKVLIVDEISMMSKKVFEILEEIGRASRLSSLPFGGIQVIFTGDFYQLPPVGSDGEKDTDKFCFESAIWNRVFKKENHVELKTMFRQRDPVYVGILSQIRKGALAEENIKLLQTYVKREYDPDLHNGCVPTKIFPIRSKVDYVNNMMFSKIQEKEHMFEFITKTDCLTYLDSTKAIPSIILQKCRELTSKFIEYEVDTLINNIPSPKVLRLKIGVSVMCTINLDMESGICNGSQGVIINIIETDKGASPIVKFSNGIIKMISPHYWQSEEYPTIAVAQYPLMLSWAITIHKIQGATLDMAEIDIGQSIFEYGQTYVALSRIKSLDGLYLSEFQPNKIKTNPKVIEFYNSLEVSNEVKKVAL
jgi:ATP-dependent DNA helicase PIF1